MYKGLACFVSCHVRRGSNRGRLGRFQSWNGLRRCGANWRQLVRKTHGGHVFKREAGGVKIKEKT